VIVVRMYKRHLLPQLFSSIAINNIVANHALITQNSIVHYSSYYITMPGASKAGHGLAGPGPIVYSWDRYWATTGTIS
jgi:hypothetical protein